MGDPMPQNSRRDLVLDAETIGRSDLDEVQQQYLATHKDGDVAMAERLALYTWTAQVVVVACGDPDTDRGCVFWDATGARGSPALPPGWKSVPLQTEAEVVARTWKTIAAYGRIVTFNGRRFDLPVLALRALALGIKVPRNPSPYRYALDNHCDLYEVLTFWGACKGFPLDFVCRSLRIPSPKQGISGAGVEAAVRDGRVHEVAQYCVGDVLAEIEIFRRVQGHLLPALQQKASSR